MLVQNASSNNKRIAKNTMFLYIRMFLMLFVGLFTSRIVLNALGETDYGIYNIIGGVVVLFSFLNQALTSATQRFLNFNIGKGDFKKVESVFCMSLNSYIILSAIFLIVSETLGLWFVNTQLNIPTERMNAANWVYQFTIITFIINLIRIPYNASIIAYERMDFFAYVSLIEVVLKLVVVYVLFIDGIDRLVIYSLLYAIVPFIVNITYKVYCGWKFKTTHFRLMWDKATFRSLFSFSSWSLFGSMANMLSQQGLNILINIFFGVTANAAVGIANTVSSQVMQFVSNFQIAFQPQIVKTYAANQISEFHKLIFRTSKFSFYMIYILSLPIILNTQILLELWLVNVPMYTTIFCQLILGFMIIETITAPLWMAVQATGKIKKYQIWMASCICLNFPLTYLVFKMGMPVYTAWCIRIVVNILTFTVRCWYMKVYLSFPVLQFVKLVIVPILTVIIISAPIPICLAIFTNQSITSFCLIILMSVIACLASIYKFGMIVEERELLKVIVFKKILKHR